MPSKGKQPARPRKRPANTRKPAEVVQHPPSVTVSVDAGPSKPARKKESGSYPPAYMNDVPYLRDYGSMVVNPKDFEPVRSPAAFAMTGDVKKFTRVFNLNAADSINGGFSMVVTPTIYNFFQLTRSTGITSPNIMSAVNDAPLVWVTNQAGNIEGTANFVINDTVAGTQLGAAETSDFQTRQALVCTCVAGAAVEFQITNGTNAATFTVAWYDPVLNAWTGPTPFYVNGRQVKTLGVLMANGCLAMNVRCNRNAPQVAINISVPANSTFNALAQTFNLYNSDAIQLSRVERYRVTALSILCSYSGNALQNGGTIASARCAPGYTFGDDPYSSLCKLTDNQYHGPMLNGCYAWWMPNSFEESEYLDISEAPASATNLRVAGKFADNTGALQITLTTVVEFYSPLQIFSHLVGPIVDDGYYDCLRQLQLIPAACCNPLHTDLLRMVESRVKKLAKHAIKNPAIALAAAKSLASMI